MPPENIYLSLGSNVGDRAAQMDRAMEMLGGAGVNILRRSSVYETEPVDFLAQGWFLNCAVAAQTTLLPRQLLGRFQEIESTLGSKKLVPRGPRALDIDLLLYGASIIRTPEVEVPHPRMAARRFVLVPLAEIAPLVAHPVLRKTIAQLLAETPDRSEVRPWRPGSG